MGRFSLTTLAASQMDARLKRLIDNYRDTVRRAVAVLEANGIPRPKSTMDCISYNVPQLGELSGGGKYFIHGFGCTVKTLDFYVDFDFGENGQIEVRLLRMADYARDRLSGTYSIADKNELKTIFDDACHAGELIDSGYILWYVNE